jgi:hypothetical protein
MGRVRATNRVLAALAACICLGVSPAIAGAAPVADQSAPGSASSYALAFTGQQLAQTFTAGRSGPLHHVRLWLNVSRDCVQPAATVALTATSDGSPLGSPLGSGTVAQAAFPAGTEIAAAWIDVVLSPVPVLTAGTQYAIVLSAPGASGLCGTLPGGYGWFMGNDAYAGGVGRSSHDGGASWPERILLGVPQDYGFVTYIDDSVAPAPTLTSPANGTLTGDGDVTFRGLAGTEPGDDVGEVRVEISAGTSPGTPVRTVTADPDDATGAFEVTASGLADGTWTAQAVQSDDAGNTGRSDPVTFTVDLTPPSAPVVITTSPQSPSPEDTILVLGVAEPGTTVEVFRTGTCTGPAATGTRAEFEDPGIAVTVPENETTVLSARAVDAAGNPSVCSNPVTYVEDSIAPDAPDLTALAPGSPSPEDQVTVTGTAEAGSAVRLYQAGDCTGPAVAVTAAELAQGVVVTVPEDATTVFSADATDAAGNTSACSDVLEYVEDSTAPETTIVSGPAEGAVIAETRPDFVFSSSEPGSTFACRLDDGPVRACDDGTFVPEADLSEGRHTLRVAATDRAGNTDPTPATRSFTVDLPDPPSSSPPAAAGTTTAGAASTAPPGPVLRLDLQGDRPQLLTEKRDVSVIVGCGPVACSIVVRASVDIQGSGRRSVRPARVSLQPWTLRRVRLATTKALRRAVRLALKRGRRATVRVTTTVTAPGQAPVTRQVAVPVRALRGSRAGGTTSP